ncbi:MAG: hypothetical protein ACR65X_16785 [Methylocystis sp.]
MAKMTLADYAQEELKKARRDLGLAAIDFSIPDEQLVEMRDTVRRQAAETQRLSKKRGLLGFLGL